MIVSGRLGPGSRIVEAVIAERLGVSRTPANNAIHRLQQEGYVTALARSKERRLIVAPLTQEDARELFEIGGQLEGLAARGAAALDRARRTPVVQRLRRLNAELSSAAKQRRPDPMRIFDLDMAFHRCYVEAGAGPRLLGLHEATKPQAERYVRLYITSLIDEIATSVEEHSVIVRAIEAGAPPAAQQAVDANRGTQPAGSRESSTRSANAGAGSCHSAERTKGAQPRSCHSERSEESHGSR